MIRKGSEYIDSIRANRDVYMNGETVRLDGAIRLTAK